MSVCFASVDQQGTTIVGNVSIADITSGEQSKAGGWGLPSEVVMVSSESTGTGPGLPASPIRTPLC